MKKHLMIDQESASALISPLKCTVNYKKPG